MRSQGERQCVIGKRGGAKSPEEQIFAFEKALTEQKELAARLWPAFSSEYFLEHYVSLAHEYGFTFSVAEAKASGIIKQYESRLTGPDEEGRKIDRLYEPNGGLSYDVDTDLQYKRRR